MAYNIGDDIASTHMRTQRVPAFLELRVHPPKTIFAEVLTICFVVGILLSLLLCAALLLDGRLALGCRLLRRDRLCFDRRRFCLPSFAGRLHYKSAIYFFIFLDDFYSPEEAAVVGTAAGGGATAVMVTKREMLENGESAGKEGGRKDVQCVGFRVGVVDTRTCSDVYFQHCFTSSMAATLRG